MNASREIRKISSLDQIWQRSYHDHIIRGDKDYANIWDYIDSNPAKWLDDLYYEQ